MLKNQPKFMAGVFMELHFIAELNNGIYKCIPEYSGGNGTDMTFMAEKYPNKIKFYDSLEEALGNKIHNNRLKAARREENYLTGKTQKETGERLNNQ